MACSDESRIDGGMTTRCINCWVLCSIKHMSGALYVHYFTIHNKTEGVTRANSRIPPYVQLRGMDMLGFGKRSCRLDRSQSPDTIPQSSLAPLDWQPRENSRPSLVLDAIPSHISRGVHMLIFLFAAAAGLAQTELGPGLEIRLLSPRLTQSLDVPNVSLGAHFQLPYSMVILPR